MRLTANNYPPPSSRRADELRDITDEIPPRFPSAEYPLRITYFDSYPLLDGGFQRTLAEIERVADRAVEGYDVYGREGEAGLLEGFFGGGADGDEVVDGG